MAEATKKEPNKTLHDVYKGYQEKAKKSKENVVKIDLTKTFNVEFTTDFKSFKKGEKLTGISQVMRDLYIANNVAKEFTPETESNSDSEE